MRKTTVVTILVAFAIAMVAMPALAGGGINCGDNGWGFSSDQTSLTTRGVSLGVSAVIGVTSDSKEIQGSMVVYDEAGKHVLALNYGVVKVFGTMPVIYLRLAGVTDPTRYEVRWSTSPITNLKSMNLATWDDQIGWAIDLSSAKLYDGLNGLTVVVVAKGGKATRLKLLGGLLGSVKVGKSDVSDTTLLWLDAGNSSVESTGTEADQEDSTEVADLAEKLNADHTGTNENFASVDARLSVLESVAHSHETVAAPQAPTASKGYRLDVYCGGKSYNGAYTFEKKDGYGYRKYTCSGNTPVIEMGEPEPASVGWVRVTIPGHSASDWKQIRPRAGGTYKLDAG